jgi:hypothetical protein
LFNKWGNELSSTDCKTIGLVLQSVGMCLKHAEIMFPFIKKQNIDKYIMKQIKPKGEEDEPIRESGI